MAAETVYLEAGVRRVRLTHPGKLLWPDGHRASRGGITKLEFARYLVEIAPVLLPHLEGRPLSLTRYPDGIDGKAFYQKRTPENAPAWLQRFPVEDEEGGVIPYLIARAPSDLAWLAQMAALEIHPWHSRADRPDHPDRLVFDLDPDPPSGLEESRRVALVVRRGLEELGLRGYPKYSGATGIHIYLALTPGRYTYRVASGFVEALGRLVARLAPDRVTQERLVRRRAGRVYIDHLQNLKGKTIVAPYLPRPLPGAPVSMPVTWEELAEPGHRPLHLREIPERIARVGDLFAPLLTEPFSLDEPLRLLAPDLAPEPDREPAPV